MLTVEAITPDFVATVQGADLSAKLSGPEVSEIEHAIWHYGVLVFRDQALTQDEQVRFGESFGPLDTGLQTKLTKKEQARIASDAITDISNVDVNGDVAARQHRMSILNVGNQFWHTDSSYEHHPFRYSILAAVSAVSWGGETEFADLRASYDALDDRTRDLVAGLSGIFFSHNTRQWLGIEDTPESLSAYPPVRWPLVRTHPGSGRKVLWVDSKVCDIPELPLHEGRALAYDLIEHITQRERVYSHCWRPNDVVMWDNRSVLHRGRRFDMTERREMRRVSTKDDSSSLGEVEDASHCLRLLGASR